MTHVQVQKKRISDLKDAVCKALHWDALTYNHFQYKVGCNYLQNYIPGDPQGIDMLVENKIFWNWWRLNWAIRDSQFVQAAADAAIPVDQLRLEYGELNDAATLAKAIYPSGMILNTGYAAMIGRVIDNTQEVLW